MSGSLPPLAAERGPAPAPDVPSPVGLARELGAMLGVDPALVTVTDDRDRSDLGRVAQVVTVWLDSNADRSVAADPARDGDRGPGLAFAAGIADPGADPRSGEASVLRFIPVLGHDGVFALLGRCGDCEATGVPVAAITGLADLGAWVVEGRAPDNGLRHTLGWDLGHMSACPWNGAEA
jgi:hypothetical protein